MRPLPEKRKEPGLTHWTGPRVLFAAALGIGLVAQSGFGQTLSAPPGLAATPGNGVVNLFWSPIPSATPICYFIYRDPVGTPTYSFTPTASLTPTFTGSPTDLTTDTTTPTDTLTGTPTPLATVLASAPGTFSDFQVVNGDSYVYSVMGLDGTRVAGTPTPGLLGQPATVGANPFAPPQAIQTVTVQTLHPGALDLFWDVPLSSFPVTGYSIYRLAITFTPNPSGTPTLVPTITSTASYTPTLSYTSTPTLPPGTFTYTPGNTSTLTSSFTPTISYTPTFTFTPTPTFPPVPVSGSSVFSPGDLVGTSALTTFSDQVQPLVGGLYYYVVIGSDENGNPGPVPTFSSLPNCPQLSRPFAPALSGVLISSVTPTPTNGMIYGIRLQWTGSLASEGVTSYQILSNGTPLATIVASPTPQATYVYDDQTIPYSASQTVQYSVVATNPNGAVTSNIFSGNIFPPSISGSIQVTPVATNQSVTVSWPQGNPGSYGLAGYLIFKSSNGIPVTGTQSPTPLPLAVVPAATLSYVDAPVSNANGLSYWVQPYATVTPGGVFASANPSVLSLGPIPVSTVSAVSTIGNNAFQVTWSGGGAGFYGAPVSYEIYREYVQNTPTPIAIVPYTQTSYTDYVTAVTPSTSMSYQVAALDSLGNPSPLSTPSNPVVSSSGSLAIPFAPASLPVLGGPDTLLYSWLLNPATDAVTAYSLYGSNPYSSNPIPTHLAVYYPTTTPTFAVPPTPWAVNNYYVVAQNATGNSTPTTLSSLAVSQMAVTAAVPLGTQAVTVSWNFTTPVPSLTPPFDSFVVYRSVTQGAQFAPLATVSASTTVYADITASAGQSFFYRVVARSTVTESSLYPNQTPAPEAGVFTWPSAPASLTANGSVSQTTLSWIPNPTVQNVQLYTVYQNGTPVATVTPSPTMDSVTVVDIPGSATGYQVVAQNAEGNSTASSVSVLLSYGSVPTLTLPTPNTTPAYAAGVWISGFQFNSTPTPLGVTSYAIYRAISPLPTASCTICWNNIGTVATSTPVFVDTGAVSGYTNYYQFVPQNGFGLLGNPNPQTGLSIDYYPAAPVSLTPMPSASAITLTWSPLGDSSVNGYYIYRSTAAFATPTPIATILGGGPATYVDNSVTNGNAYYYWVNTGAQGVTSAPASVAALAVTAPMLYLTPGPGVNNLAWNPVAVPTGAAVSGYSVQSLTMPSTPISTLTPTPGFAPIGPAIVEGLNNTTYADTSVVDSNSYVYQVAAAAPNPWGGRPILGPYSNSVGMGVTVVPQPISNLQAVSGDGLVQLRWTYQGSQKFTYTIQRKLGSAQDSSYQTIKAGYQGVDFTDSGVLDKTLYNYRIYSLDASGSSSNAAVIQALPAATPYVGNTQVTLVQNQTNNQTFNILSWAPANIPSSYYDPTKMYPLGGYYVYRSSDGGGTYQLVSSLASSEGATQTLSYSDPVQLVNGSAYTYLIWAFDAPAGVDTSNVNMVHETPYSPITAYPLSAGAALDRNAIRPNGASNERVVHVRFAVTKQGKVEIKVYSLTGTYIKTLFSNDNVGIGVWGLGDPYPVSWDAHNMAGNMVASGVYLITVEMSDHQEIDKVAVIK